MKQAAVQDDSDVVAQLAAEADYQRARAEGYRAELAAARQQAAPVQPKPEAAQPPKNVKDPVSGKTICRNFNTGQCTFRRCNFAHVPSPPAAQ